jgi:hypothetical protein
VVDGVVQPLSDHVELHTAKIIDPATASRPTHAFEGQLGNLGELLGYDLESDGLELGPGSQLTVTLYYRAERPAAVNYSRSLQLVSPSLGMAAQNDGYPQGGQNPTRSWVPGEIILDKVSLTVAQEAHPGEYILALSFYDLQNNLQRLSLQDDRGQPVPANQFNLTKLRIR